MPILRTEHEGAIERLSMGSAMAHSFSIGATVGRRMCRDRSSAATPRAGTPWVVCIAIGVSHLTPPCALARRRWNSEQVALSTPVAVTAAGLILTR
jgi:hypothetical protein